MMRVTIEDTGLDVSVTVEAGGSYNPDCLTDLKNRAVDVYERAAALRLAMANRAEGGDGDE